MLGCKGTAYQELRLDRTEILVNDPNGLRKLVELVGGTWGQIPLEKKYEIVEKAVFRTQHNPMKQVTLSSVEVTWYGRSWRRRVSV